MRPRETTSHRRPWVRRTPGDFVVLNWRAVCGTCRACTRGEPWYCFSTFNATQKMTLEDGTELSPALGIGAFADKTLVHAGQCTKVDPSARPAAVGLLGCGVMAGLGAAINTGNVGRGKSVAVIGCGGRGRRGRRRARLAGAGTIIAVDLDPKKLEWATNLGATHTVDGGDGDVVEAIQALTGGNGADVVIDAVGRPETWKQAFYARDLAGTVVLVGVPTPDMKLPDIPLIDVFGRGGALKSSWYGDCLPSRDFPMLVDLYQQGRLDLDAFVSEEIALDDVEAAFDKMHDGDVLRSVVVLSDDRPRRPRRPRRARSRLDGETFDVDNNVWVVGDDDECVVIDAPHDVDGDPRGRRRTAGSRRSSARTPTTTTSGSRRRCASAVTAPILLHPDDRPLWELTHTDELWDVDLADGQEIEVAGTTLRVLHTPGHAPGRRSASTPRTSAACSPATRLFQRRARARPAGPSATGTCSSPRSATGCSRCPTTPWCTPGTATTPRSAPSAQNVT